MYFPRTSANQGRMTNQLHQQLRENCSQNRKIFLQTLKRTKIQTNTVPTEPQTSFVFIEKTNRRWFATNCLQTVCKLILIEQTSCLRTVHKLHTMCLRTKCLQVYIRSLIFKEILGKYYEKL